nr:uncharacterized protein LOC112709287 [Arachis hypogaea]
MESGAIPYDEEDDIMAALQPQNEVLVQKRSFWNVRDIGGVGKVGMVKNFKRKNNVNILGLIETKKNEVTKFDVVQIWGNDAVDWEYVGSEGASGGLLEEKLTVWEELSFITGVCQVPICYMGDFNEIVRVDERKGANALTASAEDFRDWIWDMELVDLELNDRKFTWFRGQSCSRIDRVFVSLEWLEQFPEIRLKGGPRGLSDHCPLIVEDSRLREGLRPFRSLNSWFTHDGFLRMVKEEWRGLGEVQFTKKLKALTIPLSRWHKEKFGDIDLKVQQLEDEIKKLDDLASDGVYDRTMEARRRALVSFYKRWYIRKEIHWKQMSRSRHAKYMDKNTRYFHNLASARRRNNRIDALEASPLVGIRDGLVNKIQEEDATDLKRMPSANEIKESVWDCESSKAPGCDGYNMNFIKKCWGKIGTEFTAAVMDFFQSATVPRDSNVTWVALAPKFVGAREIKDLQPISMVGCVYKVISKVLVRRMRRVIPDLVGETQSAFVQGRKIHDGALITCKTVQWLKQRKKKSAIIELDFQKAYDRVK